MKLNCNYLCIHRSVYAYTLHSLKLYSFNFIIDLSDVYVDFLLTGMLTTTQAHTI